MSPSLETTQTWPPSILEPLSPSECALGGRGDEKQIQAQKVFGSGLADPVDLDAAANEEHGLGGQLESERRDNRLGPLDVVTLHEDVDVARGTRRAVHAQREAAAERVRNPGSVQG